AYLETAFGSDKVEGTELRSQMEEYLAGLGLLGVVDIKTSSKLLSIANVVKTPPDKHVLHLTDTPVPAGMIPGLCAHEIGTHLIRMLNNDLQPWRADRCLAGDKGRRIKLANHFATEEGLATLNALVQSEKRPNNAECMRPHRESVSFVFQYSCGRRRYGIGPRCKDRIGVSFNCLTCWSATFRTRS
ncbi:hypothetical protein FOZ62_017947, partial [Perkinsus olseni]